MLKCFAEKERTYGMDKSDASDPAALPAYPDEFLAGLDPRKLIACVTLAVRNDQATKESRIMMLVAPKRREGGKASQLCVGWGCHFDLGSYVPAPP